MLDDWGIQVKLWVYSDSSAARGFSARQGLSRMRHAQTRYLWVQERVQHGHLQVLLVRGKCNPADIFTKAVSGTIREKFLTTLGFKHIVPSINHKSLLVKGHCATVGGESTK